VTGNRHYHDGGQGTAHPTHFGSWMVSRSRGNRELSVDLRKKVHAETRRRGEKTEEAFYRLFQEPRLLQTVHVYSYRV